MVPHKLSRSLVKRLNFGSCFCVTGVMFNLAYNIVVRNKFVQALVLYFWPSSGTDLLLTDVPCRHLQNTT